MQTMALSWLVYRLSDSAAVLGFLSVARFGPSFVASPLAGVLIDRLPRRHVVLITQSLSLVQASALAALTLSGAIRVTHILILAALQGFIDTLDMPARQTLQVELVGLEDLQSAVSLNSSAFNLGRMIGPAIAGVIVAAHGEGACFAANAASYLAVLAALSFLPAGSSGRVDKKSVWSDLWEGVRFVADTARVRAVLASVAATSLFGFWYTTLLPVLARDVLRGGVVSYGLLLAGAGAGAITGALTAAARVRAEEAGRVIALAQAMLGCGLLGLGFVRSVVLGAAAMAVVGGALALQAATANGFLQVSSPERLRGRVVSLYTWLFIGVSPLGGLAAGVAGEAIGAPTAILVAGGGCVVAASLSWRALSRTGDAPGKKST